MPAAQQNGFDGCLLAQLVGLLDSPLDAEAAGALRIRVLKQKHGDIPFYEVVERPDYKAAIWDKFGKPECLRGYMNAQKLMNELRQDKAQLEKQGAALAEAVKNRDESITGLRREIAALQKTLRETQAGRNKPCRPCENKRRLMAGGAGVMIAAACFYLLPSAGGHAEGWETGGTIALALAPLAVVFCRWQWLIFRRPGGLAVGWNGLVQRMVQRLEALARQCVVEIQE